MTWLKQLFSRRRLYDDLPEEISEHLDEKIEGRAQRIRRMLYGVHPFGLLRFHISRADINYRSCQCVGSSCLARFAAGRDRSTSETSKDLECWR
jgi:hypothetical protein